MKSNPNFMAKPSAYIIGKYFKSDDSDRFEGVEEGDIYLVLHPTPENFALAKELIMNE